MGGWNLTRRIGLGAVLAVAMAASGSAQSAAFDHAAVLAHVREAMAVDRVPGLAVAVVVGGETVLLEGLGVDAAGRAVTPETGFRLGSMSKAFTALAVMRLVERGVLHLEQPVAAQLPEFRLAEGDWPSITLGHLLAHTSGIPERAGRAGRKAPLADHVAALRSVRPVAAPGQRHIYSSPNYLVAARLAEVATGKSFQAVLRDEVLAPLRLAATLVSMTEDRGRRLSGGHQYWFGFPFPAEPVDDPGRLATASLISTTADLATFLAFQLGNGTPLLSRAGLATLHQGSAEGDGFRYAMGWRDTVIAGTRAVEHGGILPDYRGKMILLPNRDAAVVVLTNVSSGLPVPAMPTSHRLADAIAAYLAGAPLRAPTVPLGVLTIGAAVGLALLLLAQLRGTIVVLLGRDPATRPLRAALLDLGVIAVIALGLPAVLGLDWLDLFANMPDLTSWAAAMAGLTLCSAVARLWRALQRRSIAQI